MFCVAFALFQAALALGAPFGQIAWGGSDAVLPTSLRWTSAGAAVYLLAAAAIMATQTAGERYGMGAASAVGCMLCLWALRPVRRRGG